MRQETGYQQSLLLSGLQTLLQLIHFLLFQILRTNFPTSTSTSPRENQVSTSTGSKLHAIDTEKQPIRQKSDADADTYYKKVSSFYFQKNPRNTSTNVLQRKGEVTLSFPIDSNQFQQFCKQLNTKEIILCTDLLQQELYGK